MEILLNDGIVWITSMHSSRMRTARLLPVSPSMHCAAVQEGCLLPGEVSVPGGFIPACTEADTPPPREQND